MDGTGGHETLKDHKVWLEKGRRHVRTESHRRSSAGGTQHRWKGTPVSSALLWPLLPSRAPPSAFPAACALEGCRRLIHPVGLPSSKGSPLGYQWASLSGQQRIQAEWWARLLPAILLQSSSGRGLHSPGPLCAPPVLVPTPRKVL